MLLAITVWGAVPEDEFRGVPAVISVPVCVSKK